MQESLLESLHSRQDGEPPLDSAVGESKPVRGGTSRARFRVGAALVFVFLAIGIVTIMAPSRVDESKSAKSISVALAPTQPDHPRVSGSTLTAVAPSDRPTSDDVVTDDDQALGEVTSKPPTDPEIAVSATTSQFPTPETPVMPPNSAQTGPATTAASKVTTTPRVSTRPTVSSSTAPQNQRPFGGLPFENGQIVASDYAVGPAVDEVWHYVTNGFHEGAGSFDASSNTQIVHRSSGGDPLPALDGQTHASYRKMHTAGPQSLWDAREQADHTRSQLGGWSPSTSFHLSKPGQREFIVYSVRLDPKTPILGSVASRNGLFWLSMVSQFKSIGPSGNGGPTLAVYEGYDGLQLKAREGDSTKYVSIVDVPRGVWLRIGVDVFWSTKGDGAYRWWGDLDGDSTVNFQPLSDRRETATILPGFDQAAFNIGPYHTLDVPVNGRDYANIEILSHRVADPWG